MSQPKGLGSPHIRGSGQPGQSPLTRREVLDELGCGCGYLAALLLLLSLVIIGGVVFVLGIDFLGRFVTKPAADALDGPIGRIVFGVAMIALAVLGTYRVYRRRSLPEVTRLGMVLWGVIALVLVVIGVIALMTAFGDRTDPSGF